MFPLLQTRRLLALSLAAAFVACAGGADARNDTSQALPAPDETDLRVQRADLARIMGDSTARVWFVIVSDFQCPYCKMWHDSAGPEIKRDYLATGKIRLAYVNYPIPSLHANAIPAAEAAMCAGAQGKFWAFHDQLFATQADWARLDNARPFFDRLGSAVGLDAAAFSQCLRDDVMLPMVEADLKRGRDGGVNGTPAFFIGSRLVKQNRPASYLRPFLDSAIAEANRVAR